MKKLTALLAGGLVALGIGSAVPANAAAFDICPSGHTGVVSGTPTSCPFADNVRRAWFNQSSNPVIAYSPVTGMAYSMACNPSTENVGSLTISGWTCYGGNNAVVVIWL